MTVPRRPSLAERVYRRLLRLFPADFRADFAGDMARDVADRADERSGRARTRVWSGELPGLAKAVLVQHLDDLRRDVTCTLRMMARSPGFSAAAILMLALGTGANAAMFSVIDAVMLRSAFDDPSRIVAVQEQAPGESPGNGIPISHLDAIFRAPAFSAAAGITYSLAVWSDAPEPHRLDIECVSASMFQVLGVRPALGRTFTAEEDRAGAPASVVLSDHVWRGDFGGATDIVGRRITLAGHTNTIIGVMPPGFLGPSQRNRTDGWAPLGPAIARQSAVGCDPRSSVNVVARVRAPLTLATATEQLNAMGLISGMPMLFGRTDGRIHLERKDDLTYDGLSTPLFALLAAVGCVLLIACANVANLQLERLIGRRQEIALRLALGAGRGRIIRQTITENLLISLLGASAGIVAAWLTLSALVSMLPANVPHVQDIRIDARTLGVTIAAALLAGLAVGLVPAIQATSVSVTGDLKASGRSTTGGAKWLRRTLVITEVALSVVLLIGAALMVRTFLILRPTDPGFDPSGRLVAQLSLPGPWSVDPGRVRLLDDAMTRVGALPGVVSVSGSSYMPLSGMTSLMNIEVGGTKADVWSSWVTPGYFRDMEMSLARGRLFAASDGWGSAPVVAINETAARRFWPDHDPIGQIVPVKSPDGSVTARQIVAILRDTRSWGTDTKHRSELYVPFAQEPAPTLLYLLVRTNGAANPALVSGIRAAVSGAIPGQVVDAIDPMQDRLDRAVSRPRFGAWIFGLFAAMAVGLAAMGLTAVIAWWVTQRRREIGLRMALGANRRQVTTLVVRQGLGLAVAGTIAGVGVASLSSRLLSDWLYGIAPMDGATYGACAAGMLAIAAIASYLPARRATRIDPIVTLRAE
jgi:putative ABC transport system permease protein